MIVAAAVAHRPLAPTPGLFDQLASATCNRAYGSPRWDSPVAGTAAVSPSGQQDAPEHPEHRAWVTLEAPPVDMGMGHRGFGECHPRSALRMPMAFTGTGVSTCVREP